MGSATVQGQLWGARAQDWAAYVEQVGLPLFGAALDAARVTPARACSMPVAARDSSRCWQPPGRAGNRP